MRFIDASVFLYAYLKPKGKLPEKIINFKKRAGDIIKKINKGEAVLTTIVHLSEVANIIESKVNNTEASRVILTLLSKPNINIVEVRKSDYINAAKFAERHSIGVNDSLAYFIMKQKGISEIYSFDKDFDKLRDIRRVI